MRAIRSDPLAPGAWDLACWVSHVLRPESAELKVSRHRWIVFAKKGLLAILRTEEDEDSMSSINGSYEHGLVLHPV
jgi:hypothetical protein